MDFKWNSILKKTHGYYYIVAYIYVDFTNGNNQER